MTYASTFEIAYANALIEFEEQQAKLGLRPPLGTRWSDINIMIRNATAKAHRRREMVANLAKQGLRPIEIAGRMGVSDQTVYNDLHRIKRK